MRNASLFQTGLTISGLCSHMLIVPSHQSTYVATCFILMADYSARFYRLFMFKPKFDKLHAVEHHFSARSPYRFEGSFTPMSSIVFTNAHAVPMQCNKPVQCHN